MRLSHASEPVPSSSDRLAGPVWRLHFASGRETPELRGLLGLDADALRTLPETQVVRDVSHGFVLRIEGTGERPALYWKTFRRKGLLNALKDRFRSSPAARAWNGSLRLECAGLHTATRIAYGETRHARPLAPRRSFLATEEIEQARSVWMFLARMHPGDAAGRVQKRALLRALGRDVARMHKARLFHQDLRLTNILCRTDAAPLLFFIDTDRIVHARLFVRYEAIRNLMQLGFSFVPTYTLTDRARIFHTYAEAMGLDRREKRRVLSRVLAGMRRRGERRLREAAQRRLHESTILEMRRFLASIEGRRA